VTDALAGLDHVARLAAAVVAGAALGLNRNMRGKAAGVRTHALVALGAALVTSAAAVVAGADAATRVMQGVLTGVGFIGAGVILHPRAGAPPAGAPPPGADPSADASAGAHADRPPHRPHADVRGLTTAATVWMAAALGIVCGLGLWAIAVASALLTLLVLEGGGPLESAAKARLRRRRARERGARRRA
jgi:putative Mg2+ transporter-C (MgtC) family protein